MTALILIVAIIVLDLVFILVVSAGFPHVLAFLDFASMVAVPLAAWMCAAAGFGLKRSLAAWKAPLDPSASEGSLRIAMAWSGSLAAWTLSFMSLAVCTGLVLTFSNLSVPEKVGPNIAVSILSIGYAALVLLLLVLPFRTIAARRLAILEN
ncbi:MAG: hypothetical protein E4H20_05880 [Spirochaetales bacterium]|nr:MAG: hypothetical protein E4H20_05880 [Spirochaetales bacterium]